MTRWGHQIQQWLISRGWKAPPPATVEPPEEAVFGDPGIIDPLTGSEINLYEAVKQHWKMTGEWPDFLPEKFKGGTEH